MEFKQTQSTSDQTGLARKNGSTLNLWSCWQGRQFLLQRLMKVKLLNSKVDIKKPPAKALCLSRAGAVPGICESWYSDDMTRFDLRLWIVLRQVSKYCLSVKGTQKWCSRDVIWYFISCAQPPHRPFRRPNGPPLWNNGGCLYLSVAYCF